MQLLGLPSLFLLASGAAAAALPTAPDYGTLSQCLSLGLSQAATVVRLSPALRWSDFDAPTPGTVVNVATESDVQVAVKCANKLNLNFLAQSGGNAWATTFKIGPRDLIINLAKLNQITFNSAKTQVTVQGGAIISQLVSAAYANNAQVVTGNCDCVGVMGAMLGGGFGRLMGKYGFMVDNVLSMKVVTAAGTTQTVTASSNPDLWFALRGAGANFGIVTSAVLKSYPTPQAQNGAWLGALIYTPDKIEALVTAIGKLNLDAKMAIFMYYATSGPPTYDPAVIAFPFYLGSADAGRAAFASIYAVGPVADTTAFTPYNQVNAGSAPFCVKGGRKPSYGAATAQLDPAAWRQIWNKYTAFLTAHGGSAVGNSTVLLEVYSLAYAKSLGDGSSSYPWRSTNRFNMVAMPWYSDPSIDADAESFGSSVRSLWRSTGKLPGNPTYINFAFGDESLQQIYGPNAPRLQSIKRRYDPQNRFNQFFPLLPR